MALTTSLCTAHWFDAYVGQEAHITTDPVVRDKFTELNNIVNVMKTARDLRPALRFGICLGCARNGTPVPDQRELLGLCVVVPCWQLGGTA